MRWPNFGGKPRGCCDRCGFEYPLATLKKEQRWAGDKLVSNGFRVCPTCMDIPHPQDRVRRRVYDDPKPVDDARPPIEEFLS